MLSAVLVQSKLDERQPFLYHRYCITLPTFI